MTRPRRGDAVEVEWKDAQHVAMGWTYASRYREETGTDVFVTIGYWNGIANGAVSLVASVGPEKVADGESIPEGSVLSIRILRRAEKRRARVFRR